MEDYFDKSLRKGDLGEEIVKTILRDNGYVLYTVDNEGSHPFDIMAVDIESHRLVVVEVKTIPRRNLYEDNGLKLTSWKKYTRWYKETGIDFFLIFVDEMTREVYGNTLQILSEHYYDRTSGLYYPLVYKDRFGFSSNDMIYLHLNKCKPFGNISDEDASKMRGLSQRKHGYAHLS